MSQCGLDLLINLAQNKILLVLKLYRTIERDKVEHCHTNKENVFVLHFQKLYWVRIISSTLLTPLDEDNGKGKFQHCRQNWRKIDDSILEITWEVLGIVRNFMGTKIPRENR